MLIDTIEFKLNHLPLEYRKFIAKYGDDLSSILSDIYSEEDIKGRSCDWYKLQQYWLAFYIVSLVKKEIEFGEDFSDLEEEYNLDFVQKALECVGIQIGDIYDIFDVDNTDNPFVYVPPPDDSELEIRSLMAIIGKLYNFDGSGYISAPSSSANNTGTGDFSFEIVFKHTSNLGIQTLVSKLDGTTGYKVYLVNGALYIYISDGTTTKDILVESSLFSNETWYHFVVGFDRDGNVKYWINGVAGTTKDISSASSADLDNTGTLYIGCYNGSSQYFAGDLFRFRLHKRFFTDNEVNLLYYSDSIPYGYTSDCTVRYDSGGFGFFTTVDKSTNENNASPSSSGIELYNVPEGDTQVYEELSISSDSTLETLESGYSIERVVIHNTSANDVTINIGTTALGNNIGRIWTIPANTINYYTVNKYLGPITIYVNSTDWNSSSLDIKFYLTHIEEVS